MNILPLQNHLLVKKVESQGSTKSGIILTGSTNEEYKIVEIIELANSFDEECKDQKMLVVGDSIMIAPHSGTNVKLDDEEYLIISYEDILAIIND